MGVVPWSPPALEGPQPPGLDDPLLLPPESPIWTLRFLLHRTHQKMLGEGRWVWVDEKGVHANRPPKVGKVGGEWKWEPVGKAPGAPPAAGWKMFELAQLNSFTLDCVKCGAPHYRFVAHCWAGLGLGGMEWKGRTWSFTPEWSAILGFGGFDPHASNRGAYSGVVAGIASRPKRKHTPKPGAGPVAEPAVAPHGGPQDAFLKALGAMQPTLDQRGTVCLQCIARCRSF